MTTITVVMDSDAQGCFLLVTVAYTYSYDNGHTYAAYLPHGIFVGLWPGAQIQSVEEIAGSWFTGSTSTQDPNHNFVYWAKDPAGQFNYDNAIPSGQDLQVRIRLNGGFCADNYPVTIKMLTGYADAGSFYDPIYLDIFTVSPPEADYAISVIGPHTPPVCKGDALTLMVDDVPAGSTVRWYRFIPANWTDPCPPTTCPLPSVWGTPVKTEYNVQPSGSSAYGCSVYHTNAMDKTKCYVAVVSYHCNVTVTDPIKVVVCPHMPDNIIKAVPDIPISVNDNLRHVCPSWEGQLCLEPENFPCGTTIVRWERRVRLLSTPTPCHPHWGPWVPLNPPGWMEVSDSEDHMCIPIDTAHPPQKMACQRQEEYRAVLENACGTITTQAFTFIIDWQINQPGTITADPSVICSGKTTVLTYHGTCGEIVGWERSERQPNGSWSPWTGINGSNSTCIWWTNELTSDTRFQVCVRNGVCAPVYSAPITVYVKPLLAVTISKNQDPACIPGVILTAQTNPSNIIAHYQWYRNGTQIGTDFFQYSPVNGGNYYVEVFGTSDACGPARSNTISLCRLRVEIVGDCCICEGETVTLQAVVSWTPVTCPDQTCTFTWYLIGTTGPVEIGTGPEINVDSPGNYTVSAQYGICPERFAEPFKLRKCSGIFFKGPGKKKEDKPVRRTKK
jgi:hypothetical protein